MDIEKAVLKETSITFSNKVEEYVWMMDVSYFESIQAIQAQYEYEPEMVAKLLSKELREKLAYEMSIANLLKK